MVSFFLKVLCAVSMHHAGALLRSRGVPGDYNPASLARASSTEVAEATARFAQIVLNDLREDLHWRDSFESNSTANRMDGFQRAKHANACTMDYHAPGWSPMVMPQKELKVNYILHGKSGSSEIRSALDTGTTALNQKMTSQLWEASTLFTIVRDPLARSVSSFWEQLFDCVGYHPDPNVKVVSAKMNKEALSYYEKMISMWEKKDHKCMGPHGVGQHSRMPDARTHPVKFVGTLAELEKDWGALGQYQSTSLGVKNWPDLPPPARVSEDYKRSLLNASLIPASLAQRVCTLFRDDYCCFQLPIPSVCKIKC